MLHGVLKMAGRVGERAVFLLFAAFFSALFQQFVVYFERGVFFVFGAVGGFCVAADTAGAFAGVGVGGGAVPLELAATAHQHLDGYSRKGDGQQYGGQNYDYEDVVHVVIQKKSRLCAAPVFAPPEGLEPSTP